MEAIKFFASLDLGQAHDPSALIVLEKAEEIVPAPYNLRHVQRFPLRVAYPDIVNYVAGFLSLPQLTGQSVLLLDATGVGAPVVDMFKEKFKQLSLPVKLYPITITGGKQVGRDARDPRHFHVPKRDLATAVKVMLDGFRLRIDQALPQRRLLQRELENFKVKITAAANDTYEAWREGDHDDLVLAIAMACWFVNRKRTKMFADLEEGPQEETRERIEIRRLNDTYEEIIVHPPKVEPHPGWTWNDLKGR